MLQARGKIDFFENLHDGPLQAIALGATLPEHLDFEAFRSVVFKGQAAHPAEFPQKGLAVFLRRRLGDIVGPAQALKRDSFQIIVGQSGCKFHQFFEERLHPTIPTVKRPTLICMTSSDDIRLTSETGSVLFPGIN